MPFSYASNLKIPEYELGEGYVYALTIERDDGEVFYYVGSTSRTPEERIIAHKATKSSRSMPVVLDGVTILGDTSQQGFTIIDIDRIITVNEPGRSRLREIERQTAYQIAIEYDTTNVTGVIP